MCRGLIVSAVYNKALALHPDSPAGSAAITLVNADVERIIAGSINLHEIWASLVEVCLAVVLLGVKLGYPCVAPVILAIGMEEFFNFSSLLDVPGGWLTFSGPIVSTVATLVLARYIGGPQRTWIKAVEKRVHQTSKVLQSLDSVFISGLADHATRIIQSLRVDELRVSRKFRLMLSWNVAVCKSSLNKARY